MNTAELRVHIDAYLNLRGSLGLQTEFTGYYLRELSNYVESTGVLLADPHTDDLGMD